MSRALKDVDGVLWVDVSLEKGSAEVRCRPDFNDPESLIQAVSEAGFTASVASEESTPPPAG